MASVTFPFISAMSFSDTGRERGPTGAGVVIVPDAGAMVVGEPVVASAAFVSAYFDASTKGEMSATGHSPGDSPTVNNTVTTSIIHGAQENVI
jgi:hypothetical protein